MRVVVGAIAESEGTAVRRSRATAAVRIRDMDVGAPTRDRNHPP
jgi:hypothetical protein